MKKLIFHVGPHKTGSTYIQKLLHENRDFLFEKGVAYPEEYYLFLGHHYLLNELNGKRESSEIRNKILDKCGECETVILSSENFISLTNNGLAKLKEVFFDYEVRFVFYLRRPSVRLFSRWHEEIKQGGAVPLESYFMDHVLRPMQSREINPSFYINSVIKNFGDDAARLVDYETAFSKNSMMSCFWDAAGEKSLVPDTDEKINKRFDLDEVEVIRYLNYKARADGVLKGSNIRESYIKKKGSFADEAALLKAGIEENKKAVVLGDTGFDKAVANLVKNQYSSILVNEPSSPVSQKYFYPDTSWLFNKSLTRLADDIYKQIFDNL